jgi:enoyl-[acyl-carrier protein] reductase I
MEERDLKMGLFEGKKGLVLGIANDRSIAWAITEQLHQQGAEIGFTHLPDAGDRPKNERKVGKLVNPIGAKFLMPCNVCEDSDLEAVMEKAAAEFGKIDFLLHSIAFAPPADLTGPTWASSREGFRLAMEISAYSLLAVCGAAKKKDLFSENSSVLTLSYFGGEEVIPGYNLMGICKAALECGVRYLASELGPDGTRVNAISAGPVKTVSAQGVGDFDQMLELYKGMAPMRRNITAEEVGKTGMFLLSDQASGISAEVVHVDCGFSKMGAPPSDFGKVAGG